MSDPFRSAFADLPNGSDVSWRDLLVVAVKGTPKEEGWVALSPVRAGVAKEIAEYRQRIANAEAALATGGEEAKAEWRTATLSMAHRVAEYCDGQPRWKDRPEWSHRIFAVVEEYARQGLPLASTPLRALAACLGAMGHVRARGAASRAAREEALHLLEGRAMLARDGRYIARVPEASVESLAATCGVSVSAFRRIRAFPGYLQRRDTGLTMLRATRGKAERVFAAAGQDHRLTWAERLANDAEYLRDWYPDGRKRPSFSDTSLVDVGIAANSIIAGRRSREARLAAYDLAFVQAMREHAPTKPVLAALAAALGIARS